MNRALAFLLRDVITLGTYPTALVLQLLSMVVSVASFYFLAKLVGLQQTNPLLLPYGGDYLSFLLVGVVFQNFLLVSQNAFSGAIANEQRLGTLEILLLSELDLPKILLYSALWSYLWAVFNSLFVFGLGILLFGMKISANFGWAFLAFLLTVSSMAGIGMISAGIILVNKQGDPISWFIGVISGFLSGVYYPVEILPPWLQGLSQVLPATHGLKAIRLTLLGNVGWGGVQDELFILLGFCLLTIPLGILVFRWGFRKSRKDGTLGFY